MDGPPGSLSGSDNGPHIWSDHARRRRTTAPPPADRPDPPLVRIGNHFSLGIGTVVPRYIMIHLNTCIAFRYVFHAYLDVSHVSSTQVTSSDVFSMYL